MIGVKKSIITMAIEIGKLTDKISSLMLEIDELKRMIPSAKEMEKKVDEYAKYRTRDGLLSFDAYEARKSKEEEGEEKW